MSLSEKFEYKRILLYVWTNDQFESYSAHLHTQGVDSRPCSKSAFFQV